MYKRECVTVKDEANYDAPIHIVVGNGGQGLTPLPGVERAFDEFLEEEFGFATLEANVNEMVINFYGDAVEDVDPPLRDTYTIKRNYPRV